MRENKFFPLLNFVVIKTPKMDFSHIVRIVVNDSNDPIINETKIRSSKRLKHTSNLIQTFIGKHKANGLLKILITLNPITLLTKQKLKNKARIGMKLIKLLS